MCVMRALHAPPSQPHVGQTHDIIGDTSDGENSFRKLFKIGDWSSTKRCIETKNN